MFQDTHVHYPPLPLKDWLIDWSKGRKMGSWSDVVIPVRKLTNTIFLILVSWQHRIMISMIKNTFIKEGNACLKLYTKTPWMLRKEKRHLCCAVVGYIIDYFHRLFTRREYPTKSYDYKCLFINKFNHLRVFISFT